MNHFVIQIHHVEFAILNFEILMQNLYSLTGPQKCTFHKSSTIFYFSVRHFESVLWILKFSYQIWILGLQKLTDIHFHKHQTIFKFKFPMLSSPFWIFKFWYKICFQRPQKYKFHNKLNHFQLFVSTILNHPFFILKI